MKRTIDTLLAICLALLVFIAWDRLTFDGRVPVPAWHGVDVLNSPIRAGERLQASIRREKVRDDCTVASNRQAINEDGVSFNMPDSVWAGGLAETDALRVDYPTPSSLPTGRYVLRVYLTYSCPDFVWTTQQPDALFRIAE